MENPIGNVDAIEFTIGGKKHVRVYYQTYDRKIRETSYEPEIGWFVRSTCVISSAARANSPVTVTRWIADNAVHIRLYFINTAGQICESVGRHTADGTTWTGGSALSLSPSASVAQGSQLAVARPDKDDKTLRVFYQEPRNNNKSPIREIKYSKIQTVWKVQPSRIEDAAENTRLSAVSAGSNSNLRIYYESSDRFLRVCHWNANSGAWNASKNVDWDWKIATNAPIVATCWYDGSADDIDNIRIRVYTILDANKTQIVELSRDGQEWNDQSKVVANIEPGQGTPATNAIGVSRENKASENAPIFVVYKPRKTYIAIAFSGPNAATIQEATQTYAFGGLPTSRY